MNPMLQQFTAVALPIMFTVLLAVWMNNKAIDGIHKRLDDMNRRFDEVMAELRAIKVKLEDHQERIIRLEERTSPLVH